MAPQHPRLAAGHLPQDEFRHGKKAVEAATTACEMRDWKDPNSIDTLAAAYAEAGEFGKAIDMQEKANDLYSDDEDRQKGNDRLALYREGKPYREEQP